MPPNTVKVDRTTCWGNPFRVGEDDRTCAEDCVEAFREEIESGGLELNFIEEHVAPQLRGKNLACWCKPGDPCHADVLLEIANR